MRSAPHPRGSRGPRPVLVGAVAVMVVAAVTIGVLFATGVFPTAPSSTAPSSTGPGSADPGSDDPRADSDVEASAPESFIYLDRAAPGDPPGLDAVIGTAVGGTDRERLYEAHGIQSFAVLDRVLVVATVAGDGTSIVTIVSRIDGTTDQTILPAGAVIDRLAAAPAVGMVGFTLSTPEGAPAGVFTDVLFQLDLTGEQLAEPVLSPDGSPISSTSWTFLPGTGTIAAHTASDEVVLVDTSGDRRGETVGSYLGLDGSSPDGSILVVSDEFGAVALTLSDRSEDRLEAAPVQGVRPSGGEIALLPGGASRVQRVAVLNEETGRFASYVVVDSGEQSRVLYENPDGRSSIESFTVSSTGRYVAVAIVPDIATSVSDGHSLSPMSTSVTTRIIDIDSGEVLGSVAGFHAIW